MIYIIEDTYTNFTRFSIDKFPIQKEMTKNDCVIICSDFGGVRSHDIQEGTYKEDYLTDYLQEISEKCEFNKWYFGHYHDNRQINSQFVLLYEDIVPLEFENIF